MGATDWILGLGILGGVVIGGYLLLKDFKLPSLFPSLPDLPPVQPIIPFLPPLDWSFIPEGMTMEEWLKAREEERAQQKIEFEQKMTSAKELIRRMSEPVMVPAPIFRVETAGTGAFVKEDISLVQQGYKAISMKGRDLPL